jgi:hypothetical protein
MGFNSGFKGLIQLLYKGEGELVSAHADAGMGGGGRSIAPLFLNIGTS